MSDSERDEMFYELGQLLAAATLDQWEELHFDLAAVHDIAMPRFTMVRLDDSSQRIPPPRKAARMLSELRPSMHLPGRGTWFTARYVLDHAGSHRVEFDYDGEPEFDFPVAAGAYAADLRVFPRDDSSIPDWLRTKLDAAPYS